MRAVSYSKPDGCNDYDARDTATRKWIEARLLGFFRLYGYEQITLPSVEYADLYNPRTIGSDLFYRLLSADISESARFPTAELESPTQKRPRQGDRIFDVVLRPEFTAPVARWFLSRLVDGGEPAILPARLAYAGQIFRDVDPALERLKESRQIGCELIGSDRRWGDLEVLCLACEAAADLDLPSWRLHLGHALLYRQILSSYGVGEEILAQVASHVEIAARIAREVAKPDDEVFLSYVRSFLRTHRSRFPPDHPGLDDPGRLSTDRWRAELPDVHDAFLRDLWEGKGFGLARETVARILDLARLGGESDEFFSGLDHLVRSDEVKRSMEELRWLCEALRREQGVSPLLTPASRGLAYYTGLTFEIHCPMGTSPETSVCGGGRYDGLPGWIYRRILETRELRGERSDPPMEGAEELLNGVGLAFSLESLAEALAGAEPALAPGALVFVVALDEALAAEAFRFSARLRTSHRIATRYHLPAPGTLTGIREATDLADRLAARFTVFFSPDEWRQGQVGLYDRVSRRQEARTLEAALDDITAALVERSDP